MAKTIIFNAPTRLFGENFANRDQKVFHKFHNFEAQKPIQVQTLIKCVSNGNYDFTLDGFSYKEISPELLEVIS